MDEEPFRLLPPKPPKKKCEPDEQKRQGLLLVDMNDLPGQQTFFRVNGPKETTNEK